MVKDELKYLTERVDFISENLVNRLDKEKICVRIHELEELTQHAISLASGACKEIYHKIDEADILNRLHSIEDDFEGFRKELYARADHEDSIVYTREELRNLVAEIWRARDLETGTDLLQNYLEGKDDDEE